MVSIFPIFLFPNDSPIFYSRSWLPLPSQEAKNRRRDTTGMESFCERGCCLCYGYELAGWLAGRIAMEGWLAFKNTKIYKDEGSFCKNSKYQHRSVLA